jgi:CHAD domain-containing protein
MFAPERELKLAAPAGFRVPDLGGVLPGVTARSLPTRRLRALYWDTQDLRLTRGGISLRRRSGDGPARWTVKLPASCAGGVMSRREVEFDGGSSAVPEGALRLLRAHLRGAPLGPVVELDSVRARVELLGTDGRALAEVDDDDVSVLDGSAVRGGFREVEVELADGAPVSVTEAVSRALRRAGASDTEPLPKVSRALAGLGRPLPADLRQGLAPEATVGELVRCAIADAVSRLMRHDPGVRLGEDPEDVHQARVATRRLSSYLRCASSLLERDWERSLRAELRWIADLLGGVRDVDVLMQRLWRDTSLLGECDLEPARRLLDAAAASRARGVESLWEAMESPRYLQLVERLVGASESPRLAPEASRPAAKVARSLAARPWRRLSRQVASLGPAPDDAELHRVRIRAKRCRYSADLASLVVGGPAKRFSRAMARIQDTLGDLHDAAVAEAWLRSEAAGAPGPVAVAAGELVAAERRAAAERRREWPGVWKRSSRRSLRRWMR